MNTSHDPATLIKPEADLENTPPLLGTLVDGTPVTAPVAIALSSSWLLFRCAHYTTI
jgi:hypothetical protein